MKGDPTFAVLCHCTDCQKATGSAFGANLFFKDATATRPINRGFCTCGSRMFIHPTTLPGKEEPIILVASGVVDDIHSKDTKWQPSVEGYCIPKREWLGSFGQVKSFEGIFKLKS
ncbi:Mss4-like protein [Pterulicium gracile]|uniref:Mss4-like protein n=1 Tax=Pterulicium gracile TaxID=1884261 RepID=A0A5C3QIE5_9AGAR|nr:Mss4-like protein [Pterula gracilis]